MKLIIFCITVGISLMFIYYQNLRKEIDARQKWLETVLTGEKKWILENQRDLYHNVRSAWLPPGRAPHRSDRP